MTESDVTNYCKLCVLFVEDDIKTHFWWKDDDWIVVDCASCKIPMAVYRDHVSDLPVEKIRAISEKMKATFGAGSLRLPRQILDHIHYHWIRET